MWTIDWEGIHEANNVLMHPDARSYRAAIKEVREIELRRIAREHLGHRAHAFNLLAIAHFIACLREAMHGLDEPGCLIVKAWIIDGLTEPSCADLSNGSTLPLAAKPAADKPEQEDTTHVSSR